MSTLKFTYPMTLCLLQDILAMVVSFVAVRVGVVELKHKHIVTPRFYVTRILPVGFCLTLSLVLGELFGANRAQPVLLYLLKR